MICFFSLGVYFGQFLGFKEVTLDFRAQNGEFCDILLTSLKNSDAGVYWIFLERSYSGLINRGITRSLFVGEKLEVIIWSSPRVNRS